MREYLQWECRSEAGWPHDSGLFVLAIFTAEQFEVPGAVSVHKVDIW